MFSGDQSFLLSSLNLPLRHAVELLAKIHDVKYICMYIGDELFCYLFFCDQSFDLSYRKGIILLWDQNCMLEMFQYQGGVVMYDERRTVQISHSYISLKFPFLCV